MIDLQVHTTASDGKLGLDKILDLARQRMVTVLAITDHDTISAWSAENLHQNLGQAISRTSHRQTYTDRFFFEGITVIQGEEITCKYSESHDHEIHMLAYFLDEQAVKGSNLELHNRRRAHATAERAKQVIKSLHEAGYDLSYDEIAAQVTNPHGLTREFIARKLLKRNAIRLDQELGQKELSVSNVRDRLLGPGGQFYTPIKNHYRLSEEAGPVPIPTVEATVHMILGCGGVPVLSHPGRYAFISQPELRQKMEATHTMAPTLTPEEVITHLIACSGGLAGIEAFNSWHTEQQNAFWKDLADKYSIFYTVGTDFHGDDDCVLGVPAVSEHPVHRLYETCERVRNKKI